MFGRKLQGKTGQEFSGKTGGLSYAVATAIGQRVIAIVRLRFAARSHGY